MQLEGIGDKDICKLDLPNGIPIVYRFHLASSLHYKPTYLFFQRLDVDLQVIGERQYLADEETVSSEFASH